MEDEIGSWSGRKNSLAAGYPAFGRIYRKGLVDGMQKSFQITMNQESITLYPLNCLFASDPLSYNGLEVAVKPHLIPKTA